MTADSRPERRAVFGCVRGFARWLGRSTTVGEVAYALGLHPGQVVLAVHEAHALLGDECRIGLEADLGNPAASWTLRSLARQESATCCAETVARPRAPSHCKACGATSQAEVQSRCTAHPDEPCEGMYIGAGETDA